MIEKLLGDARRSLFVTGRVGAQNERRYDFFRGEPMTMTDEQLTKAYASQPYGSRPTLSLLKTSASCAYCGGHRGSSRACEGCGAS